MSTEDPFRAPDGVPERFEVVRKLGQGGMATVYLARDSLAGTDVALKVLHPHLRDDVLVLERFRREIAAARRVIHPNVVAIFDLIDGDDATMLVLEYHPGADLKQTIRRRRQIPVEEAVRIAVQVLDGLGAAHDNGVIHRDIKPHNILLDEKGVARITDLGLARVDDLVGVTTHTVALGTPEYMAPEMLSEPAVDGRADLYALGVTLFEMLTGRLPFVAATPLDLLRQHEEAAIPSARDHAPDVPEAVAATVRRAMAKAPEDRFATASEMKVALLEPDSVHAGDEASGESGQCPSCKAPLLAGLNVCIECGREKCTIGRTAGRGYSVYVTRRNTVTVAKSDMDPLTFAQKHRLIEAVGELGAQPAMEVKRLDMRMRTPPFVVADHLTKADAAAVKVHLDLPVSFLGPSILGRIAAVFIFGNFASVLGRLLLAGLVGGGLIAAVFKAFDVPDPWSSVAYLVLIVVTLGTIARGVVKRLKPITVFDGRAGTTTVSDAFFSRAPDVMKRLGSRRLKGLVRRALTRGIEVRARIEAAELPQGMLREVDAVLDGALDLADRLAALESDLAANSPAAIHEELEALDARIGVTTDMDDVAELIDEKVQLRARLADMDEMEGQRVLLTGRLLAVSSRLRALTDESDSLLAGGESELSSASMILRDLESELSAHVELNHELRR